MYAQLNSKKRRYFVLVITGLCLFGVLYSFIEVIKQRNIVFDVSNCQLNKPNMQQRLKSKESRNYKSDNIYRVKILDGYIVKYWKALFDPKKGDHLWRKKRMKKSTFFSDVSTDTITNTNHTSNTSVNRINKQTTLSYGALLGTQESTLTAGVETVTTSEILEPISRATTVGSISQASTSTTISNIKDFAPTASLTTNNVNNEHMNPTEETKITSNACFLGNICERYRPCKNGGICINHNDNCSYECICSSNFIGSNCEISKSVCFEMCGYYNCTLYNGVHVCSDQIAQIGRKCGGYECIHGYCKKTSVDSNRYRCICNANYAGNNCEHLCNLNCQNGGQCYVSTDNDKQCHCPNNFDGNYCEISKPCTLVCSWDETCVFESRKMICQVLHPDLQWYVVGSSVLLLCLIILLLLLLARWMYKKRMLWIMKLVYKFQTSEDTDDYTYDAFVSFKSGTSDEKFVAHRLRKLMEMDNNYKLCLHFRDFIPGETIADNIIRAIEESRRTILVLSPSYVTSEWCRLEYQKAQHEMLKLRHKIIPIVLEDISHLHKEMDKSLRCILDSVTYLKWPKSQDDRKEEKFWELLLLSMPKKNQMSLRKDSGTSTVTINTII